MITPKLARSASARAAVVARLVPSDRLKASGVDKRLLTRLRFEGKPGQTATVTGDAPAVTLLVGVGTSGDVDATGVRKGAAAAVRGLSSHRAVVVDTSLVDETDDLSADAIAQAAAEGTALAAYRDDRFRAPSDDPVVESATVVVPGGGKAGFARGLAISEAVCFARDLVNAPGSTLTATRFAELAVEHGEAVGLRVEVLGPDEIAAEKMGGVLAVNRGSTQEPRFVKMTYTPAEPVTDESVALVGKGLTFDSGGLSIKPGEAMMTMKNDMAGGAAVVATMTALPTVGVGVPVTAYVPMTDNMTGPDATRPGDVFTARSGTTVEVLNTDAEGRLILGDALSKASDDGHGVIVDLATLTGACLVALGDQIAGLMGNDDDLVGEIRDAAGRSGEKVWHLPLPPEYRKQLDSQIADLKNIGSRFGGTLTAGLYLQEFVGEGVQWAHLDIAGPAFLDAADAEIPKGGTGFGVRALIEWLEGRARDAATAADESEDADADA